MKRFDYSFFGKLIYKYMYLPVLLLFGIQLGFALYGMKYDSANALPAIINMAILYIIFRFYNRIRKNIPFVIEINNGEITGYGYLMNKKILKENIKDIIKIDGGIFSGKPASPVLIYFKDGEIFGVLPHLKNYTDFISEILQKVDKKIHDETVLKIKEVADSRMKKKKKHSAKE